MKENAIYLMLLETTQYMQYATCWGQLPHTLTAGGGAFTWGAYSADYCAAGAIANDFQLVGAMVGQPSANANYEVEIVYGPTDIPCCHTKFCRSSPFISSLPILARSPRLPAGSRVRARMRDSAGGNTVMMCLMYHLFS